MEHGAQKGLQPRRHCTPSTHSDAATKPPAPTRLLHVAAGQQGLVGGARDQAAVEPEVDRGCRKRGQGGPAEAWGPHARCAPPPTCMRRGPAPEARSGKACQCTARPREQRRPAPRTHVIPFGVHPGVAHGDALQVQRRPALGQLAVVLENGLGQQRHGVACRAAGQERRPGQGITGGLVPERQAAAGQWQRRHP